ncbi:UBX domain-containing protein 8 [Pelobates fuscus]|uniref:UBX domain-containing protein 8 n=1 Tax=Pelobates fuscus TaxID=191477 RepID=UPI002FE48B6E
MTGTKSQIACCMLLLLFIWMGTASQPREVFLWMAKFALFTCLLTLLISVLTPWISSFRQSREEHLEFSVPEEEKDKHQKLVRRDQQEQLSQKASYYMENFMKPREELKLKRKMEHYYKMTGQSWKLTEGQRLGADEEDDAMNIDSDGDGSIAKTPNKEALRKRKLPEHVKMHVPKPEKPKPKKVITLPEEPNELEEGVVTVALRCPSGRVFKRRFYKICSSHVLLDWMTKLGYHPVLYTLYSSSPRCHIELNTELSIESIGIVKDTLLNVEQIHQP